MRALASLTTFLTLVLAVSAWPLDIEHLDNYKFGDKCTPKEVFLVKCNICICGGNGDTAACTKMGCSGFGEEQRSLTVALKKDVPRVPGFTEGDKCPAEVFFDQCNICICGDDTTSTQCTGLICPSEEPRNEVKKIEHPHKDGHKQGDIRRSRARISSWPHVDGYVFGDKCPPGKMFFNECNICRCSDDGTRAICTMIFCIPEYIEWLQK